MVKVVSVEPFTPKMIITLIENMHSRLLEKCTSKQFAEQIQSVLDEDPSNDDSYWELNQAQQERYDKQFEEEKYKKIIQLIEHLDKNKLIEVFVDKDGIENFIDCIDDYESTIVLNTYPYRAPKKEETEQVSDFITFYKPKKKNDECKTNKPQSNKRRSKA